MIKNLLERKKLISQSDMANKVGHPAKISLWFMITPALLALQALLATPTGQVYMHRIERSNDTDGYR